MTIGNRIKSAREESGMTQGELGKICGVTKQTIFKSENNIITNIPFDKIKLISSALNVSAAYIMGWETDSGGVDIGIAQLETGMSEEETINLIDQIENPNSIMLSHSERVHIRKYRSLDDYGKTAVDGLLDVEYKRVADARRLTDPEPESTNIIRFRVPQYREPMSAGFGDAIGTVYAEDIELIKEPPRGTSFIARIDGDSMEPTYHNGDWVFVHSQNEIRIGEVGVFYMDGKEWIKELGNGELISHNIEYPPRPMTEDVRCQGIVLGVCDENYFE